MKPCSHCGETKPLDEFYQYDGRPMNACKACIRFRSRANRAANLEYYREYDRQRAFDPGRVAARKAYAAAHRQDDKLRAKRWTTRHTDKRKAHIIVNNAVRDGSLVKAPCQRCGEPKGVHAHHEDYSRPLDVMWLCKPCHGLRHRQINAARRKVA